MPGFRGSERVLAAASIHEEPRGETQSVKPEFVRDPPV